MFTEKGIELIEKAKEFDLIDYLNPYSGNFGFTEEQLNDNQEKIKNWLRNNAEFFLLYQYCDVDCPCWFLTDWLE